MHYVRAKTYIVSIRPQYMDTIIQQLGTAHPLTSYISSYTAIKAPKLPAHACPIAVKKINHYRYCYSNKKPWPYMATAVDSIRNRNDRREIVIKLKQDACKIHAGSNWDNEVPVIVLYLYQCVPRVQVYLITALIIN